MAASSITDLVDLMVAGSSFSEAIDEFEEEVNTGGEKGIASSGGASRQIKAKAFGKINLKSVPGGP